VPTVRDDASPERQAVAGGTHLHQDDLRFFALHYDDRFLGRLHDVRDEIPSAL
jgi:hypothetical protein